MKSPLKHGRMDHFPKVCHSTFQWRPSGDPRWPVVENRGVLRISKWVDWYFLLLEADPSLCNFIQLRSVYLSHRVNTDVERRRRGEMNSPVPQRAPCYCVSGMNTKKKGTGTRFCFLQLAAPRLLLAHFDVRKVEGNQSHFLLSARCGLLLPGVRKLGGRLAVKHGRSGKCAQRRDAAKHNTGKPPARGGSHRSGRTDGARIGAPSSLFNL